MQNLENYKCKTLQDAAKDYMAECGLEIRNLWSKDDWVTFAYWLFEETTFKFKIEYTVSNVPYLQEFILNATDPTDAVKKFLEFMGQNTSSIKIVRISSGGKE